jgi:hypothetical protein
MRKLLLLFCVWMLITTACTDNEVDDLLIRRNGVVSFEIGNDTWRAQSFQLINLGKVVVFTGEEDATGTVYQRLFFLVSGKNANGGERNLTMVIDLPQGDRLLGLATTDYTLAEGGIRSIEFTDQPAGSSGPYKLYQLPSHQEDSFVDFQRQSLKEKLVAGEFHFQLEDATDATQTLTLHNGMFKDIPYTNL